MMRTGIAVVVWVAVACGSSEDSSGNVAVSRGDAAADERTHSTLPAGVTGRRVLSSLDSEEALASCDALGARLVHGVEDTDWARLSCTSIVRALLQGDAGADALGTCEELVAECVVAGVATRRAPSLDCRPDALPAALRACELTLSVYELCIEAESSYWRGVVAGPSCDDRGPVLETEVRDPSSLAACLPVAERCPDLLRRDRVAAVPAADAAAPSDGCHDGCRYASDHECDDGGEGAETALCALGSDCSDCGPR